VSGAGPGRFGRASAVTALGDGRFAAEVAPGWDIAGNADGGYLLAIAARAVTVATDRPDPVTVTAHFLAPGRPGPVAVLVDPVRAGRRHATAAFRLVSGPAADPVVHLVGVCTTADLGAVTGPERVDATPPALPPVADCVPVEPGDPFPPPFMAQVDVRLHPDDVPFRARAGSGSPRVRGWFRLRDDEPVDPVGLVLAVDAFPPTSFNADLPVAWTPTLELTAHLRHRPAPGWLACAFVTRNIRGGYLETDGEVWDASGVLVAQSRQLQLVPPTR